ncbi:hypothetical protein P7K49_007915, partial [Saguinus oedipus]
MPESPHLVDVASPGPLPTLDRHQESLTMALLSPQRWPMQPQLPGLFSALRDQAR